MHANETAAAGRGRRIRRIGVGMADQLLYSASNFALTVLVAHSSSVTGFGAYSLVLASYLIVNVTARGLTSETLVIRFSDTTGRTWRRAANAAAGTSVVLGVLSGAAIAGVGAATSGGIASSMYVLGACLPGLMLQDHLRYSALARGKPSFALANDLTQVVIQFAIAGVLIYFDKASAPYLIAAWGGASYVGAVVGALMLRVRPVPLATWAWLRDNRDLAIPYAADDLGAQVSQNGINFVLAAAVGLRAPAALRGAATVFGPPAILNLGVQSATMPELVRTLRTSSRRMARGALAIGTAMCISGAVWGGLALIAPESVGHFLFGPTWPLARPLLIFFLISQSAAGLRMAPDVGLRALGAANRSVIVRVLAIVLGLGFQLAGALVDGVRGVAISKAVFGPIWLAMTWWQYRRALADYRQRVGLLKMQQDWDSLVQSVPETERIPALALWSNYE